MQHARHPRCCSVPYGGCDRDPDGADRDHRGSAREAARVGDAPVNVGPKSGRYTHVGNRVAGACTWAPAKRVYTAVGSSGRILKTAPGRVDDPAGDWHAIAKLDLGIDGCRATAHMVDGSCLLRCARAFDCRLTAYCLDAHSETHRDCDSSTASPGYRMMLPR